MLTVDMRLIRKLAVAVLLVIRLESAMATPDGRDRDWTSRQSGQVFHVVPQDPAEAYEDVQACIAKLNGPGDECRLAGGVYDFSGKPPLTIQSKHGNGTHPIVLAGALGEDVQFSGTSDVILSSDWKQDGEVWYATVEQPGDGISQLFDGNQMYTPARWPDAFWHDYTMFLGPERWGHFNASIHNLTTGHGEITDGGTCDPMPKPTDVRVHCDRVPGLAESGIDATGAVVVLNMWGCDSGAQLVTAHVPGSATLLYNATHYPHCDKQWPAGRYYLVGKREFVTGPTEWMFDKRTSTLYVIPAPGKDIQSLKLRAKHSSWALNVTDSSYITIANLSFFATALLASDAGLDAHPPPDPAPYPKPRPGGFISHIKLEGLQFNYPAVSRRMLGSISPPDTVTIYAPDVPGSPHFRNLTIFNCSFYGSDGPSILINANYMIISQCVFNRTDWSGVGSSPRTPGRDGHMCTLTVAGRGALVSRSTFAYNGNSACLCVGPASSVSLCHFYGQAELQGDGTTVEGSGEANVSQHITHNWSRDSGKGAYRLDAPPTAPPGKTPPGSGSFILYNVAINTSGIAVKGGGHVIDHNTAVDNTFIMANDPTVSYRFQKPGDALNKTWTDPHIKQCLFSENHNSQEGASTVFTYNAADSIHLGNSRLGDGNVIGGFDAGQDLRDAWNLDFRPCPNSVIARSKAGAYDSNISTSYWIPGRQQWQASMPIPSNRGTDVVIDTSLMFLGAMNADRHSVFYGYAEDDLIHIGDLQGEENVIHYHPVELLHSHQQVYWRVDATVAGLVVPGTLWSFTTGNRTAC